MYTMSKLCMHQRGKRHKYLLLEAKNTQPGHYISPCQNNQFIALQLLNHDCVHAKMKAYPSVVLLAWTLLERSTIAVSQGEQACIMYRRPFYWCSNNTNS